MVIFATGYRSALPQILPSLMPLITMHDKNTFKVRDDFTLEWVARKENNIFVVNASMQNPWHRRTPAQPDGMEICTYS